MTSSVKLEVHSVS